MWGGCQCLSHAAVLRKLRLAQQCRHLQRTGPACYSILDSGLMCSDLMPHTCGLSGRGSTPVQASDRLCERPLHLLLVFSNQAGSAVEAAAQARARHCIVKQPESAPFIPSAALVDSGWLTAGQSRAAALIDCGWISAGLRTAAALVDCGCRTAGQRRAGLPPL